jgi:hypothetical protein
MTEEEQVLFNIATQYTDGAITAYEFVSKIINYGMSVQDILLVQHNEALGQTES